MCITVMKKENFAMLCDFYEFTTVNGFLSCGLAEKITCFDVFFRSIPDGGGFAIAAGLEQVIDYIENLKFEDEDIEYLRSKGIFDEKFLDYLKAFHFTGDIHAVPEGTPVFPGEPILTVKAPAAQAQLIETFLLVSINHQSLIATKANRIVRAAQKREVLEFGAHRAQGVSGAVLGARAAFIGGCAGTSCVLADQLYKVSASVAMTNSWVQMFDGEYEAFRTYCELYPHNTTLLVDTYNTLESGIPNAIRAFKEILLPQGVETFAVRLDSGDLSYLSKKARLLLDHAGLTQCKIMASNSLDEYIIRDIIQQGAEIDTFGVVERLITAASTSGFDGVYKLVAIVEEDGHVIPKIKLSENIAKITNPHLKRVYRLFDNETGMAIADQLCVYNEEIDESQPLTIFDQIAIWKTKTLTNFTAKELLVPIFVDGKRIYNSPTVLEIQEYCRGETAKLWDEVKRFENPHTYYVDLSQQLWDVKQQLLVEYGKRRI